MKIARKGMTMRDRSRRRDFRCRPGIDRARVLLLFGHLGLTGALCGEGDPLVPLTTPPIVYTIDEGTFSRYQRRVLVR